MAENIDFVLQKLVTTGQRWHTYRPEPQRRKEVVAVFDELHPTISSRLDWIHIAQRDGAGDFAGTLSVVFDPITRRIEGMEVAEPLSAGLLLTLRFWPGLEQAQKLFASTVKQWDLAVENGFLDDYL